MKTVVVFSHPYFERSKVNKALLKVAKDTLGSENVRFLDEIYGEKTKSFDIAKEQKFLESADRIIFQFPLYFYATPAILKAYLDEVFTYGWAYGSTGVLTGKDVQVAVSVGGTIADYSKFGRAKHDMSEILAPFEASMNYCGMDFGEPFVVDDSSNISDERLNECCEIYKKLLKNEDWKEALD
ncbi:NAD(P)H-dependent oxidoreductase [Campylobacter suis]|uniref:General stress protein 14 n=1 Tax=Campylobacter suis TaxID=2790657 RepID=A0ABM8Q6Y2_9BACT|nr:NAD(P)H-dependent oxidoreductase [Campylobacter suis]CAD7288728.1 General stress protein 14 [Campylobacter suis]